MKRIYNTFIYITIVSFFASCSAFLDVTPVDKVLEDDQFSTEIGITGALNGIYRQMISNHLYGAQLSQTTVETMGRVYTYSDVSPSAGFVYTEIYSLVNGDYANNGNVESRFANIWKTGYNTVYNMNHFLESVEKSSAIISPEHKELVMGEVYGMRAFLHFDIFRLFGPRYEERSDINKILPYNRSTDVVLNHTGYEEDVYSTAEEYMGFVLADITKAEQLLKSDPIRTDLSAVSNDLVSDIYKNRNRRMNYYAVKALKARVLQYMGDIKNAAIAAKEVTDQVGDNKPFKWTNASNVVSKQDFSFYKEVIFGIDSPDMQSNYNSFYTKTSLLDVYVVDRNHLIKNIYAGFGENMSTIIDVRSSQWVLSKSTSSSSFSIDGAYLSNKFNMADNTYIPALVNYQPLMRITEMYYIMSEAYLKEGNKPEAAKLLNMISEKRGISDTNDYILSGDEEEAIFDSHIMTEYYKEFYGEGQVFFYHKRKKSTQMFKGNNEGMSDINVTKTYTVDIPKIETNI